MENTNNKKVSKKAKLQYYNSQYHVTDSNFVLALVRDNPNLSGEQLFKKAREVDNKIKAVTVNARLSELKSAGYIVVSGKIKDPETKQKVSIFRVIEQYRSMNLAVLAIIKKKKESEKSIRLVDQALAVLSDVTHLVFHLDNLSQFEKRTELHNIATLTRNLLVAEEQNKLAKLILKEMDAKKMSLHLRKHSEAA